jgi:hypothetical protein
MSAGILIIDHYSFFLALLNDKSYRLIRKFEIIGEAVNKATVRWQFLLF